MTEGDVLMDHLERSLGEFSGRGTAASEWNIPFSVWQFDDVPEQDVTTLVTFGISAHLLVGSDQAEHRQEVLVSMRTQFDDESVDIAVSIGAYLLDRHVALLEGETVAIPAELRGSLDRMVVARPDHIDPELARCEGFEPAVELLWLLPFAPDESHVAIEHGWRDLLAWLRSSEADPYDLRRPSRV